jgi:hypothetical protein
MMNGFHDNYIQAAIEGEIARLAASQEGERNNNLFKATASLAGLGLREGEILSHLKPVAEQIGLRGRELYSTVKSGVKAGASRPRTPVDSRISPTRRQEQAPTCPVDIPREPIRMAGGEGGPRVGIDELRRHIYRRNGKAVRVKIKRSSGYVNWYRVEVRDEFVWQSGKPGGYAPCPYVGAVNPFNQTETSDWVYWPEGERDCDTLGNRGLPALTFGGAGDGLPDGIEEYLRNRKIVILADNDAAGREHANKKAAVAYPLASIVKLIEFSELPPKSDVTDYLMAATVADLIKRVTAAAAWMPNSIPTVAGDRPSWRNDIITAGELSRKTFAPLRYVVPGYITEGVTIFAGKPKIGKSWLLYDICIGCSSDRFVLGTVKPTQGDVLYLALEDSQRRLQSRLAKLCPHSSISDRLTLTTNWRRAQEGGVRDIAEWCESVPNPTLVVIDTLEKFRPPAKAGVAAYTTDYEAITELHKLSHERGIAVVVIHHVRKMDAEDPFDMVSGTNGLTGAADTILVLKRQAGAVTLHARGRDIDEQETACEFNKSSCRWTLLGQAEEVHSSGQRLAILAALKEADDGGLHISEILTATARTDRNAVDQLLYKMHRDREVVRIKRGVYAMPDKIGKKERKDSQPAEGA